MTAKVKCVEFLKLNECDRLCDNGCQMMPLISRCSRNNVKLSIFCHIGLGVEVVICVFPELSFRRYCLRKYCDTRMTVITLATRKYGVHA